MQHSSDKQQKRKNKSADLEQHLAAYYGPRVREQPLSQDAWQQLRRKLNKPVRRRMRLHWPTRHVQRRWFHRTSQSLPEYVHAAFNSIAYDARFSYSSSLLHCTFKRELRAPGVHISSLRKRPIRLLLPGDTDHSLSAPGLNVLLATGMARYQLVKKAVLIYLLLMGFFVSGVGAAFFYALHNRPLAAFLIASIDGLSLLFLLDRQKRHFCYAADTLVVLWIGRGRTCDGLHALTNVTRSPYRSRWGEPSLEARIARVCGTRVESGNEHLTMVR